MKPGLFATALGLAAFLAPLPGAAAKDGYFFGADLSFANEMNDCGARFSDGGVEKDLFRIVKDHGANIVRVRIWNDADWTNYSNLDDVKRTIRRTKAEGMQTLLDFHYSDDWADGGKQVIPKAWAKLGSVEAEARAVYDYTLKTLMALDAEGLLPEMVQVGNETNGEIMRPTEDTPNEPINWARNAAILNAGIKAVRDAARQADSDIGVMLHIAQPENVEPWFDAAKAAGVTDYDYIGVSYYRKWSSETLNGLGKAINRLRHKFDAEVILVETAYPWTMDADDSSSNVLGPDTLLEDYPATPEGQRRYMLDISQLTIANGGVGVVYWEPAWVSTGCKTRWGTGSSWENAAIFGYGNPHAALLALDYLDHAYAYPVEVTFHLPAKADKDAYRLAGEFIGAGISGRFGASKAGSVFTTRLMPGQRISYQLVDDRTGVVVHSGDVTIGSAAMRVSLPVN